MRAPSNYRGNGRLSGCRSGVDISGALRETAGNTAAPHGHMQKSRRGSFITEAPHARVFFKNIADGDRAACYGLPMRPPPHRVEE